MLQFPRQPSLAMTTCSEEEVSSFRAYQTLRSHLAHVVVPLLERVPLNRTSVVGLTDIGRLCAFFKTIGDVHAVDYIRTERFTVAAAVQLLDDPRFKQDPGIAEARTKVAEYVTKFAQPESSPCVTLVNFRDGAVILDGNKTCMAAFIHARQVRDYSLPVYRLEDLTRTIRQAIG